MLFRSLVLILIRLLRPECRRRRIMGDGEVVGYMQCVRLGEDEGALQVAKEKKMWWSGWRSGDMGCI